jgi:hypothetical protein
MADVTINPGRAGRAAVTIRVSHEDFSLFAAKAVRLAMDPPADSGKSIDLDARLHADGTWTVSDIPLAQPGIWTVRVIVISQSGETIVLDAPIVIDR